MKNTSSQTACGAFDEDCAPPIPCELERGHAGEHQWSGERNAPKLKKLGENGEQHEYENAPKKFVKKFSIATPEVATPVTAAAPVPSEKSQRVAAILAANTNPNPEAK